MEGSASPRKPRVRMSSSCSAVFSFDVAWFSKASATWEGAMPQPLSVTRSESMPPFLMSMVTAVAPASMAFSISSLATDEGRSTTSPAAMRPTTEGSNTRIGIAFLLKSCVLFR